MLASLQLLGPEALSPVLHDPQRLLVQVKVRRSGPTRVGAGRDGAVESASWAYRWRLWSRGWVIDPQLVDAAYLHGVAVLSLVQVLGLELLFFMAFSRVARSS